MQQVELVQQLGEQDLELTWVLVYVLGLRRAVLEGSCLGRGLEDVCSPDLFLAERGELFLPEEVAVLWC